MLLKFTPWRAQLHNPIDLNPKLLWGVSYFEPSKLIFLVYYWALWWSGYACSGPWDSSAAILLSQFIKQLSTIINNHIVLSNVRWQLRALWWSAWARSGPRGMWCSYQSTNCLSQLTTLSSSAMSADNNEFSDDLVGRTLGQKVGGRNWLILLEP